MGLPTSQKADHKDLRKKIAEHGLTEVEILIDLPDGQTRSITGSRVLLVLETLYNKAIQEGSLNAAQQYLDRILGKPKESLSLTNDSEGIGQLTDDQLIEKIVAIVKATGKGAAGESS